MNALDDGADRVVLATRAILASEKANGEVLGIATTIRCPCCKVDNALKFLRNLRHVYFQCRTPECVPQTRASDRGRKR